MSRAEGFTDVQWCAPPRGPLGAWDGLKSDLSSKPERGSGLWTTKPMMGNAHPIIIPYGGVEVSAEASGRMQKSSKVRGSSGGIRYLLAGAEGLNDEEGNLLPQLFWNGDPQGYTGPDGYLGWPGTLVNEPSRDETANVVLVDVSGELGDPRYPEECKISPRMRIGWALETDLERPVELLGYYNLVVSLRSVASMGYCSNQASSEAPTRGKLSVGREASRAVAEGARALREAEQLSADLLQEKQQQAGRASRFKQELQTRIRERNGQRARVARAGKQAKQDEY
ncbi:hypothetical protein B484DRAFT_450921 [Ochromonadaceae sp. CCMP2298]|nr:hypothetical protein B484DRAFT_450921 [Ochromonadaceae sp. CCMP2298]